MTILPDQVIGASLRTCDQARFGVNQIVRANNTRLIASVAVAMELTTDTRAKRNMIDSVSADNVR